MMMMMMTFDRLNQHPFLYRYKSVSGLNLVLFPRIMVHVSILQVVSIHTGLLLVHFKNLIPLRFSKLVMPSRV